MKVFQYDVVELGGALADVEKLNAKGSLGWKLVAVSRAPGGKAKPLGYMQRQEDLAPIVEARNLELFDEFAGKTWLVISLIPGHPTDTVVFDVADARLRGQVSVPVGPSGEALGISFPRLQPTLGGLRSETGLRDDSPLQYVELFRWGCIEWGWSLLYRGDGPYLAGQSDRASVVQAIAFIAGLCRQYMPNTTTGVTLRVYNAESVWLATSSGRPNDNQSNRFGKKLLSIGPVWSPNLTAEYGDVAKWLLDRLWQAFGRESCGN